MTVYLNKQSVPSGQEPMPLEYDSAKDFAWLLAKPWIWFPRLFEVLGTMTVLGVMFLVEGSSKEILIQKRFAKRLLTTLTKLGPCFIKVGQSLSTRPDLVKRIWLDELTKLQDDLPPFSHEIALKILEEELGAPAEQIFEEFPDHPVAAASLGQVYKARLKGNYWVAVKVQRPNLSFIIRRDLVLIRILCIFSSPILPLNLGFGLGEIIDEFGRSLFREIDYRKEADNAIFFASFFANNSAVKVPEVERIISSNKVLTTSWIEGVKLHDAKKLKSNQYDIKALIRTGVISGLQQLLEFGYFHADPHPGNMFALNGKTGELGNIAYVDFGMMDSISDRDRLKLTGAVVHLINDDFKSLAKDFVDLGFLNPEIDLTPIVPVLKEVLGGSLGDSVQTFNFKSITDKFSELMFDYPFRVPARFALIIRAVVSQEGLALSLDPNFKIIRIAYPYVAKRLISGDTSEMLDILIDVIFDNDGNLRVERIKNLMDILSTESSNNEQSSILPIAKAGLELILKPEASLLRQRLLLTLVKNDKLDTSDMKALIKLLRRTFRPRAIINEVSQKFNPLQRFKV